MTHPQKRSVDIRPDIDPFFPRLVRYARYGLGYTYYINKPAVWPAIYRKVRDKIMGRIPGPQKLREMAQAATDWCAPRTVTTREGLARIGISEMLYLRDACPEILKAAEERAGNIPVWMGGGSNLDLLYTLCQKFKPETIVETGVANGWSSLTFLFYLSKQNKGSLNSVDLPLLELHNDNYVGVAVPSELRSRWNLHRMADREGLPKILSTHPVIDFVYYDSDKSPEGRFFAYSLLWKHLKSGGVLVSDDIADNMAFADFCATVNLEPIVVAEAGRNPQGILIKP